MKSVKLRGVQVFLVLTSTAAPFILIATVSNGQSTQAGAPLTTANGARTLLLSRLNQLEPACQMSLPSSDVLSETLKRVKGFWDVSSSLGDYTQDSIAQNNSNFLLRNTAYNAEAFVLPDFAHNVFPNMIFLRPNFFSSRDRRRQANVLLHELLHIHFNLGDPELCHHFGLACTTDTSYKITEWLMNGCRTAEGDRQ